jgi:hypothetical protein
MSTRCAVASLFFGFLLAQAASAHNLAPAYLALRELGGGEVAVLWKQPASVPRGSHPLPMLPCPEASAPPQRLDGDAVVREWRIACARSLAGARVAVDGLAQSGTDVLLRAALADGREVRAILSANAPAFVVPARESRSAVLASYAELGIAHLFGGLDHLLFVAGLTLLLGASRRLLVAITAFTAGHCMTLALAALGLVRVPAAAVEVAIAGTIVALAVSLARAHGAPLAHAEQVTPHAPVLARRPALLPFAFGLLHGLGFASALVGLGLPQHAIPLALLSFNLGIELGQLAWVGFLLALAFAAMRLGAARWAPRRAAVAHEAATTAIGALGVFWCLDRAAGFLFP